MIEVLLELKLNSFLVNSTGDSGGLSARMSTRMLRFTCEKVLAAKHLTEDKPSADFEFLGAAAKQGNQVGGDAEFDNQLMTYLSQRRQVEISKVMIAFGEAGYCVNPKEDNNGEIGRLFIRELPDKKGLDVEMVLKQNEFDDIWALTTQQNIQKVVGTFICFKPKLAGPGVESDVKQVAGILSSSLQLLPNV